MAINETITTLREAEKLSVRQLARLSQVHENTIFRAEKGLNINWDTAERVLDALGHEVLIVPRDAKKLVSSESEEATPHQVHPASAEASVQEVRP